MNVKPPAPAPCNSCPYRQDVPSGIWNQEEYEKLPRFDGETWEQDPSIFTCHRQDGRLCAGWVAVHDMPESLGLRLALSSGVIHHADIDAIMDYQTAVPLFDSGAEAAAHGLRDLPAPGMKAQRMMSKILERRWDDDNST